MQQDFAHLAVDRQVEKDDLVDPVVVVLVMWIILVIPFGLAGIRIARENAVGPFVVARSLLLIPRPRIGGPRRAG